MSGANALRAIIPAEMDAASYLERIGYHGPVSPTYDTLKALQRANMLSVPFENLDIVPLHRPIRLDEQALWDKIVVQRRGGFCYELNGLFAWLLRQLGFRVTYLNARVVGSKTGKLGPDFDHLAMLVQSPEAQGKWLADVGFGDSFLDPLHFRSDEQPQGLRSYRLDEEAAGYFVWQRDYSGVWKRLYFFDMIPHDFPAEYEPSCLYHQRSPDSHFTRQAVVSRLTEQGRITLEQDRLIITENTGRRETPIRQEEWPALLKQHFGIVL